MNDIEKVAVWINALLQSNGMELTASCGSYGSNYGVYIADNHTGEIVSLNEAVERGLTHVRNDEN